MDETFTIDELLGPMTLELQARLKASRPKAGLSPEELRKLLEMADRHAAHTAELKELDRRHAA